MAATYDIRSKRLVVGGFLVTGLEEGTSIEAERYEDGFSMQVGIDGKVVRSRNANQSGHIDFSLQQGNPLNAVFSAMIVADESGLGVPVPVLLVDADALPTLPESAGGKAAWFKKVPKQTYGAKSSGHKYVLDIENMAQIIGGYASFN